MRTLIFGLLLTLALAAGCSNNSPTQPTTPPSSDFAKFIRFDGPPYLLTRYSQPGYNLGSEPVVNWEACLGEPYTDNDSNGAYTHYIDGFTPADDINHNGYYDGPGVAYEPGMKFDDIDSNGVIRPLTYDYVHYEDSLPYCDFNGNGRHDSTLPDAYYMFHRQIVNVTTTTQRVEFWSVDRFYRFVSDSGYAYDLPEMGGQPIQSTLWFLLDPRGLSVHPEYLPDTISFPLVERTNVVSPDTTLIYLNPGGDTAYAYLRHIQPHDSLVTTTTNGTVHVYNLLHVSLTRTVPQHGPYDYDYYFTDSTGLYAIHTYPTEHGSSDWLYFGPRYSQIPLPMKR